MITSILKLISAFCLLILLFSIFTFGQDNTSIRLTASGQPEIYFVHDVIGQFNKLALKPDALAFGIGGQPDPTTGQHFQGIVRKHGPGKPYMFLSRSGNDVPECFPCDDRPGNIFIVRMDSRDTNGERLRSNRLVRDWPIAELLPDSSPNPWPTPPDARDKTVARIDFDGQNGWPNYGHPGGMQMVGDVLVVPLEHPYENGDLENRILFIDVSNPETPLLKSQFDPRKDTPASSDFGAGLVGVAPVLNPTGIGVRYIMLVAGGQNKEVRLYRSLPTCEEGWTDLKSINLKWEHLRSWSGAEMDDPGKDTWPDEHVHQMFNFVRQQSMTGSLFLIAGRNNASVNTPGSGDDILDLYQVHVDQYGNPADHLLTRIERKEVSTFSIGGGGDSSHFSGSTGAYISPSGEIIVYASEHDNDGPAQLMSDGSAGRHTVRFGEWRHREMVRPNSPTLKPSVEAGGTFEVDEGSSEILTAFGKAAITKAWLQLFEDDGMGLTIPGVLDTDSWVAIDYQDWSKDNYDNFTKLLWYFNDNAGSWRWFAPVGCSLSVYQHSFNDSEFPGRTKSLFGTGQVEEAADLDVVKDNEDSGSMNDMISSMRFFCDTYYSAPIKVTWDFDGDGVFDRAGNIQTFSAAELSGPSDSFIPIRGQHPTDTTALGLGEPTTIKVHIRNVAPTIASFDLVDPLGFKVGIDVPFVIANLQYAAQGSFTDPGKPDHQEAQLDFGDGTVVQSDDFNEYTDAFGGVMGKLKQYKAYSASGSFTIHLKVDDLEGGVTTATKTVTVVTPAQIIKGVVDKIDLLLATATNRTVIRALRDARDNLAGNNNTANNGALSALAGGDLVAALEKIGAAIEALQRAEAAGAGDLSELKTLLGFAAESIAQGAYQDAVAAVGTPSSGQDTQLQRIRQSIVDGHARLVNRQYVPAMDLFKDAVGRALSLL